ncbi:uncharacterized protein LOC142163156 [Nicotiana tabacum]|uniref:Uncharacterized protein LOC142163156 n=1 Tax=Nicotiana tabacum TaxID=4097 RepID=A0AC58RUV9_TOBAC
MANEDQFMMFLAKCVLLVSIIGKYLGGTISRYFNKCLKACLRLGKYYVKQAGKGVPQEISSNPLFYPWYKDCIGAIDGTHIHAFISMEDQPRYRNRKRVLSQNVLAVVDFDMNFQYMLVGREGSASDSRILRNAIWERSSNKLKIPTRKYYIVDAGYANTKGLFSTLSCKHMEEEIEDFHNLDGIDSDSDDEEFGQGPTDIDKQYMCNLRDGIAHQIWNARSIR